VKPGLCRAFLFAINKPHRQMTHVHKKRGKSCANKFVATKRLLLSRYEMREDVPLDPRAVAA